MEQYGLGSRVLEPVSGLGIAADRELLAYLDRTVEWASHAFLGGDGNRDVTAIAPADRASTYGGLHIQGFGNGRLRLRSGGGTQCAVTFRRDSDWWQLRDQAGRAAFHVLFAQLGDVFHWTHEVIGEACRFTSLIRSPAAHEAGSRTLMEHAVRVLRSAQIAGFAFPLAELKARPVPIPGDDPDRDAYLGRAMLVGRQLEAEVGVAGLGDLAVAVAEASCALDREPCGHEVCPADAAVAQWVEKHERRAVLHELLELG
jgi:hypothetical protein